MLIAVCLDKSHICKNSGSWDMDQNALEKSDCRTFKSAISLEKKRWKAWFFACPYKLIEIKTWLKNIGVVVVLTLVAGL